MNSNPIVSVVIPVWNVEPNLRECLDSVVSQSIGPDRLEVLAVDDGSTDGSGPLLDEYAEQYPQVRVFHESNSGGPGRPRNVGLDNALGTYVFFLDADDYLGREALERLVGMAEKNGSDVVLGKMVGVGGRRVPGRAFRHTTRPGKAAPGVLHPQRSEDVSSLIDRTGRRSISGRASEQRGRHLHPTYVPRLGARVTLRISRNRNVQLSISQSATRRIPGLVAQAARRRLHRLPLLLTSIGPKRLSRMRPKSND